MATDFHGVILCLVAIVLLLSAFGVSLVIRRYLHHRPRLRAAAINLALTFYSLAFTGLLVEAWFFFDVRSDGLGFTLRAQRWHDLYWKPINSLGYRDYERHPDALESKHVVFSVGDSFAAGAGIRRMEDRYSDVLDGMLGPEFEVVSVAWPGLDTVDQLKAVKEYPVKPEIIILQYFWNDIRHAAVELGLPWGFEFDSPPEWLAPVINHSYAANYLYWLYARPSRLEGGGTFGKRLKEHSQDRDVWVRHKEQLSEFVEYARENGIHLLALIIPALRNLEESEHINAKVRDFFESQNVPVVDITPFVKQGDPAEFTVTPMDAHANEALHQVIAEKLYERLQTLNGNRAVRVRH